MPRRWDGSAGFSVIEVMVGMFILVVAILGSLVLINTANLTGFTNKARTGAVNLARQVQEGAPGVQGTVPYGNLADGCPVPSSLANPCPTTSAFVSTLQEQPGLAGDPGSPTVWKITRDEVTYTIKTAVCSMDDPADGYGNHGSDGPYCSDATAGTADSQPDDYKRVAIEVTWENGPGDHTVRAVTLIHSTGVNGPAVTCLASAGNSCPDAPDITDTATTSLTFNATISGTATALEWSVDGVFQGAVTPDGESASFTWSLGTVGSGSEVFDGVYEVSATAYDENGNAGTVGTVQVRVNRRAPVSPGDYNAGYNTAIDLDGASGGVDLDWLPIPDRDVLYYRIYRQEGSGGAELIDETEDASVTSYTDTSVSTSMSVWDEIASCPYPAPLNPAPVYYYVVAVDQSGSSPREGTPTASIDATTCNHAPTDPAVDALTGTANASGTFTVEWSVPSGTDDIDVGDQINSFRIYRWGGGERGTADRIEYVVRRDVSSWTDAAPSPGGVEQSYCVTYVDTHMQESQCSNAVTG